MGNFDHRSILVDSGSIVQCGEKKSRVGDEEDPKLGFPMLPEDSSLVTLLWDSEEGFLSWSSNCESRFTQPGSLDTWGGDRS